ncbi:MAG: PDZ domain-containing protein [Gammaproteobacteria bacterium]|nr:PDZ domain-containing protein [Gammaproteobacteria bacterium]
MNIELRLLKSASLLGLALLAGCISYEPAILVPSLTMSAEDIILNDNPDAANAQLNFGLTVALNESDSLVNVEVLPGIRVLGVDNNGAADSAGIQVGDVILSVNGMDTNHPDTLAALQQQSGGVTEFTFIVRRNTVVFEAQLVGRAVNGNAPARELYRIDPLATRAAYTTEMVSLRGQSNIAVARVVELLPDSPLIVAGIGVGDRVMAIDGVNLNSAQSLITRLNRDYSLGDRVQFSVFDGQELETLMVDLWDPGRRISRLSLWPLLTYQSSLNPPRNSLSILDFWLFAVYSYNRVEGERAHSLLGIFNFTSDYGELVEEQD